MLVQLVHAGKESGCNVGTASPPEDVRKSLKLKCATCDEYVLVEVEQTTAVERRAKRRRDAVSAVVVFALLGPVIVLFSGLLTGDYGELWHWFAAPVLCSLFGLLMAPIILSETTELLKVRPTPDAKYSHTAILAPK